MIRTRFACLALALMAAAGPAAHADRAALQAACFAPAQLLSDPAERVAQRLPRGAGAAAPRAAQSTPAAPAAIRGAIRRVQLPPGRKLVALTLDFCEEPGQISGYDGAIIDILRQHKVHATMFFGGKWMTSHQARATQIMTDPLFEIGTHGWAHRNTRLISGAALRTEIAAPSIAYDQLRTGVANAQCAAPHKTEVQSIPPRPSLFRFPFGSCNAEGLAAVAEAGLLAIQWDVSTGDPSPGQTAAAIVNEMVRHAHPGSIIIAHANGRGVHTAEALPEAITRLRAKGFEFVTVSQLLAAGQPVVTETCYDSHPGDTDKYDTLFLPKAVHSNANPKPPVPQ